MRSEASSPNSECRERILDLHVLGESRGEIVRKLGLSYNTVNPIIPTITRDVQLKNFSEYIKFRASRAGVVALKPKALVEDAVHIDILPRVNLRYIRFAGRVLSEIGFVRHSERGPYWSPDP